MTKQKNLFSWLGLGKKTAEPETDPKKQPENAEKDTGVTPGGPDAELKSEQSAVTESPALPDKPQAAQSDGPLTKENDATVTASIEPAHQTPPLAVTSESVTVTPAKKAGFFSRLRQGLTKTSQNLGDGLAGLFSGKKLMMNCMRNWKLSY